MSDLTLPPNFPFDDAAVSYFVTPMQAGDLDLVMRIEERAFPAPWPASAYRYELAQNTLATYLTLKQRRAPPRGPRDALRLFRKKPRPPILAYGGFWLMVDEAHISTIATHPDWRGLGLGEMMLIALIDAAICRRAALVTLEVRVSNLTAQNLYQKYDLAIVGQRKKYYHDNNEDALIMTTPQLDDAVFLTHYAQLKARLRDRLIDATKNDAMTRKGKNNGK